MRRTTAGGREHGQERADRDSGASLIEFALVLPVFAMLLFGMISAGLAVNEKQQMTYATREGARYAATVPATQSFTAGTWAENVRNLVVGRSSGTLSAADVCVSLVEGSPGAVLTPTADYSTASGGGPCIPGQSFPVTANDAGRRVQVTATKDAAIDLILFGSIALTMETDATTRSEAGS